MGDAARRFKFGIQVDYMTSTLQRMNYPKWCLVRVTSFIFWDPLSKFGFGEDKHFKLRTEIERLPSNR